MPDQATILDTAKKLERWASGLPADEKTALEGWMRLGTDAEPYTGKWWFTPAAGNARPSEREAE